MLEETGVPLKECRRGRAQDGFLMHRDSLLCGFTHFESLLLFSWAYYSCYVLQPCIVRQLAIVPYINQGHTDDLPCLHFPTSLAGWRSSGPDPRAGLCDCRASRKSALQLLVHYIG